VLIVWNVESEIPVDSEMPEAKFKLQFKLEGHTAGVNSVAWGPKDHQLASGSYDNTVIFWDLASDNKITVFKGHSQTVNSVAWSPTWKNMPEEKSKLALEELRKFEFQILKIGKNYLKFEKCWAAENIRWNQERAVEEWPEKVSFIIRNCTNLKSLSIRSILS
jgi:hypothetical protein